MDKQWHCQGRGGSSIVICSLHQVPKKSLDDTVVLPVRPAVQQGLNLPPRQHVSRGL